MKTWGEKAERERKELNWNISKYFSRLPFLIFLSELLKCIRTDSWIFCLIYIGQIKSQIYKLEGHQKPSHPTPSFYRGENHSPQNWSGFTQGCIRLNLNLGPLTPKLCLFPLYHTKFREVLWCNRKNLVCPLFSKRTSRKNTRVYSPTLLFTIWS